MCSCIDKVRNGTGFIQQGAEEELAKIAEQVKTKKDFKPEFGATVSLNDLAERMTEKVGNTDNDAASTCRAIFMAGLQPPIKDASDPRRAVLMMAMKDAHEMVRVAAAKVLFLNSDVKSDRSEAAGVLVDIAKNSGNAGCQRDALLFVRHVQTLQNKDKYRPGDLAMMDWAFEQVPRAPRPDQPSRSKLSSVDETSIAYQKSFEKMKVQIATNSTDLLNLTWRHWDHFVNEKGLSLLSPAACRKACETAAKQRWEGHSWEKRTNSWDYVKAEEKIVTDRIRAQAKVQFDQFIQLAKSKEDLEDGGKQARNLLMHIVMTNGQCLSPELRDEGVVAAAKAIEDICCSGGPGRGRMVNGLQMMLTELPQLSQDVRKRLLNAYNALIEPDGSVRRETAASILALALNCENRSLGKPGQPGYDESIKLQLAIMERVMENANQEMLPLLKGWANFHESKVVRDKAQFYHDLLKRGPKVTVGGGKVSEVEYVTGQKRMFAFEGEVLVKVTDVDGRIWNRLKNNGGVGYSDRWSCGDEKDIRKDLTVDADGAYHYTQGSERRTVRPDLTRSKKLQ